MFSLFTHFADKAKTICFSKNVCNKGPGKKTLNYCKRMIYKENKELIELNKFFDPVIDLKEMWSDEDESTVNKKECNDTALPSTTSSKLVINDQVSKQLGALIAQMTAFSDRFRALEDAINVVNTRMDSLADLTANSGASVGETTNSHQAPSDDDAKNVIDGNDEQYTDEDDDFFLPPLDLKVD